MTTKVLTQFKIKIGSLSLSPFADGRFEVFVDDKRIYSKLETGQFPDEDAIVKAIEAI